jgi:hypothetical protein
MPRCGIKGEARRTKADAPPRGGFSVGLGTPLIVRADVAAIKRPAQADHPPPRASALVQF